ncbi:hypothetical protein PCCS19_05030 [Paenibacillus sp. CCS19]|uniref:DUF4304 domain-containing protein n=1 Tax=Paenibacillus sp. CCS19 TaxID=3158387 RepID=UPI00256E4DF3|nr:DUF4304 domain-containing protein [Paenibacillus cellulosilyticus]GMK37449.1 hypothetical protein PCCS19_05030 [Paenibacillus cellulosilyticus]
MYIEEQKKIVNEIITPRMKNLGFKKSSYNYYKKVDDNVGVCFNLQGNKYNDREEARFTFNVGTFLPNAYEVYINLNSNTELPKFPKEYNCIDRKRIGQLKHTTDLWYTLNPSTDIETIHKEVSNDLDHYIIPYIQEITLEKLLETSDETLGWSDKIVLTIFKIQSGLVAEGDETLKKLYRAKPNNYIAEQIRMIAAKYNMSLE